MPRINHAQLLREEKKSTRQAPRTHIAPLSEKKLLINIIFLQDLSIFYACIKELGDNCSGIHGYGTDAITAMMVRLHPKMRTVMV